MEKLSIKSRTSFKEIKKIFFLGLIMSLLIMIGGIIQPRNAYAADTAIGDDYPAQWKNLPLGATLDTWKMATRYCTSFVANRLSNTNKFNISRDGLDWNANQWGNNAKIQGYKVDFSPQRGSVAYWNSKYHVAWVAAVEGNSVLIEEYNYDYNGNYHSRWINKNDVDGYIHFKDVPSSLDKVSINNYLTLTKDGQDFYGNTDCTIKKGKTVRGRIYYSKIAYKLPNGQLLYSVYTDEKATEWLGYLKEGAFEFTPIQSVNKKRVTIKTGNATLWTDLNYKGKLGSSVAGDTYIVDRIFYNSTNGAYYHELYQGNTFCGYINSDFVQDLTSQSINKYVTITKDGLEVYGNLERTTVKSKTTRGRIYYTKIAYNLGDGKLLYSLYTDEKATEWLGYLKEGAFEFTPIQSVNKKRVTIKTENATLWTDLNYKGKLGSSIAGDTYIVDRIFYNSTNGAYYHELYQGNTFCGYINSDFVQDLTSQSINKYVTITKDGLEVYGNLERTTVKSKTTRGRIYYTKIAYNLGDGKLLYSLYTDEKATEWLGYLKEGAFEFTPIQSVNKKRVTIKTGNATLWTDLNYKRKLGSSVAGDTYIVDRIFYNSTNGAYYHELYQGNTFCGYINSDFVQDLTSQSINKYVTITKDGLEVYGNLERTTIKSKTTRGRIYYTKIAYNLGDGKLLYSLYTDEKATEWLGYLKEGAFEFTPIQLLDKKIITIKTTNATLWQDLNYKGKLGVSVAGDKYVVNRVFYNVTNNASYHELYQGDTFCGYINSDFVENGVESTFEKEKVGSIQLIELSGSE